MVNRLVVTSNFPWSRLDLHRFLLLHKATIGWYYLFHFLYLFHNLTTEFNHVSKSFVFSCKPCVHANGLEAFGDLVLEGDAPAVTLKDVVEDMTA